MELKNKTILIISQQDWGSMFISKHHYAVTLGKMGNKVYYLNGPDQRQKMKPGQITVTASGYENVFLVEHRLTFPYFLKFKARWVYDYLLRSHIHKLVQQLNGHIDLVWSFDLSNTIPLQLFPKSARKIYMPVDELQKGIAIKAAEGADVIASVTQEILDKFNAVSVPKVFLNHGVADYFINISVSDVVNKPVQIGLSGNFLRADIDTDILLQIIKSNTDVVFNFWGLVDYKGSNLLAEGDTDQLGFITELRMQPNVKLHGQVAPIKLAEAFKKVDCFLICYDVMKDQSKGTNYHKILEYLATGKVVVSNNVSTYSKYPGMLEMVSNRESNKELPILFKNIIANLKEYNSLQKQQQRIHFAQQFLYRNQIAKIEEFLN